MGVAMPIGVCMPRFELAGFRRGQNPRKMDQPPELKTMNRI